MYELLLIKIDINFRNVGFQMATFFGSGTVLTKNTLFIISKNIVVSSRAHTKEINTKEINTKQNTPTHTQKIIMER